MKKELDFYPPLNIDFILRRSPVNFLTRLPNQIDWSKYNSKNSDQFISLAKAGKYLYIKTPNDFYKNDFPSLKSTKQTFDTTNAPSQNSDKTKIKTSFEIMRKLGFNEQLFHGISESSRCYIYRCVIIQSKIDLYSKLDLVNKAIKEWISLHPMLHSIIIPEKNQSNQNPEYFFAKAPDNLAYSLNNIKYLHYKSNCSRYCDDIWKLYLEKEIETPMSKEPDEAALGWRLTFLNIKYFNDFSNSEPTKKYCYAVIMTYDHAIMDGRSSYTSLLQLFSIIESHFSFSTKKFTESQVFPSKEEIFNSSVNRCGQVGDDKYLKAPQYLDIKNANKSSYIRLKCLNEEEENSGCIYNQLDNSVDVSVKQLNVISQFNCSKFRTLLIKQPEFAKILKKCKENKVKLTSFLNLVLIAAFKLMNSKNDKFNSSAESINYTTNVSLREFDEFKQRCDAKVDRNEIVGCYIGQISSSFNKNFTFSDSAKWKSEFWSYANEESVRFHEKLKMKQFVHTLTLPYGNKEPDDYLYHFGMSNLGALKSSLTEQKLIEIKQSFAATKYSSDSFLCWFTNLIATVDNELCWTISFNAHVIKQEIISSFIEYITKVIKELIK